MRTVLLTAAVPALGLALLVAGPARANEEMLARSLAATCAGCHGTTGHSATKTVESLAGQRKARIIGLMQSFRSGKKPATIMHQISKGYSDAQIELIAGYFAAQKK